MNPKRIPKIPLALFVTSVFLFQSCATIIHGTSQKIPITSNPSGAKIIVDGEIMGITPLNLHLKKRKKHLLRIEKDGYNSLEIKIKRGGTSSGLLIAGDLIVGGGLGYLIFSMFSSSDATHRDLLFFWGCSISGVLALDYIGGGLYELSPADLQVTLTKIEDQARIDLIILEAGQFQNIKWIRIKCVDNDKEEIVN